VVPNHENGLFAFICCILQSSLNQIIIFSNPVFVVLIKRLKIIQAGIEFAAHGTEDFRTHLCLTLFLWFPLDKTKERDSMKTNAKWVLRLGVMVLVSFVLVVGGVAISSENPSKIYGKLAPTRVTKLGTAINHFAAFLVKCTGNKSTQGAMHSISLKKVTEKEASEVVQVVFACFPKKGKKTAQK
jgi:hypothetical protein